jgi:hypothetical protein
VTFEKWEMTLSKEYKNKNKNKNKKRREREVGDVSVCPQLHR